MTQVIFENGVAHLYPSNGGHLTVTNDQAGKDTVQQQLSALDQGIKNQWAALTTTSPVTGNLVVMPSHEFLENVFAFVGISEKFGWDKGADALEIFKLQYWQTLVAGQAAGGGQ